MKEIYNILEQIVDILDRLDSDIDYIDSDPDDSMCGCYPKNAREIQKIREAVEELKKC